MLLCVSVTFDDVIHFHDALFKRFDLRGEHWQ